MHQNSVRICKHLGCGRSRLGIARLRRQGKIGGVWTFKRKVREVEQMRVPSSSISDPQSRWTPLALGYEVFTRRNPARLSLCTRLAQLLGAGVEVDAVCFSAYSRSRSSPSGPGELAVDC